MPAAPAACSTAASTCGARSASSGSASASAPPPPASTATGTATAGPGARVTLLTLLLLVFGVVVALAVVPGLAEVRNDHVLRWWVLVPAFALAETLVVHLELRNEAHTFTLVEVPLLLGLCFASPGDL